MDNSLQKLASQLRCPEGDAGKVLGNAMNMRNLPVILNGISNLKLNDGHHILELGYGNGGLLGYILSLADNLRYTGLEISPLMHQEASAFNHAYIQAGWAAYHLYDGVTLPLGEAIFDKVLTINTIYFWQEPTLLLQNICRTLKVGGHFCITFCERSFMEKLPFIEHGFQLYNTPEVNALMHGLPLKLIAEDRKKDKSISKTGEIVDREFISLVFERTEASF
ncbi:methyltransferase [Chania multitudinisentens RB-25]|uniref:Methyltransferase n=1 Tax=Chania multitudinisentens RB-25 TaxID=1441930 RepID=W0LHV9_9GAMM|nr:methyltransferase domain-containing protein [Chania multitudinisentens]AHG21907.1 methyltransferase [Chania multitudinisentens RB-25]